MNVSHLIRGLASGYAHRVILFFSAIFLVPFFLSEGALGIAGYGEVFAIVAYTNILALFTSPLHISFSRTISKAIGDRGDAGFDGLQHPLGTGLKILLSVCLVLFGATTLWNRDLLSFMGLPLTQDAETALILGVLSYSLENGLLLLRVPLIARGHIDFVNSVYMLETLGRALGFFVWFSWMGASLQAYFTVQLVSIVFRQLCLATYLKARYPNDLRSLLRAPWLKDLASLRYSLRTTALAASDTLVERVPVIVASKFLGPIESGYVALTIQTIRGYVVQTLSSVLQPIAVPIAARLDFENMSARRISFLWSLEASYTLCVGIIVSALMVGLPWLVSVWLGREYLVIVIPAQLLLASCALDLAFSLKRALLTGQGLLHFASIRIALIAVGYFGLMGLILLSDDWRLIVILAGAFAGLVSVIAIGGTFRTVAAMFNPGELWRPVAFCLGSAAVSMSLSLLSGENFPRICGSLLATLVVVLALGHIILIPLPQAVATVRELFRSKDQNMFR